MRVKNRGQFLAALAHGAHGVDLRLGVEREETLPVRRPGWVRGSNSGSRDCRARSGRRFPRPAISAPDAAAGSRWGAAGGRRSWFAAHRAGRVLAQVHVAPFHGLGIEHEQAAVQGPADAGQDLDGFGGLDAADDAGGRARARRFRNSSRRFHPCPDTGSDNRRCPADRRGRSSPGLPGGSPRRR